MNRFLEMKPFLKNICAFLFGGSLNGAIRVCGGNTPLFFTDSFGNKLRIASFVCNVRLAIYIHQSIIIHLK